MNTREETSEQDASLSKPKSSNLSEESEKIISSAGEGLEQFYKRFEDWRSSLDLLLQLQDVTLAETTSKEKAEEDEQLEHIVKLSLTYQTTGEKEKEDDRDFSLNILQDEKLYSLPGSPLMFTTPLNTQRTRAKTLPEELPPLLDCEDEHLQEQDSPTESPRQRRR